MRLLHGLDLVQNNPRRNSPDQSKHYVLVAPCHWGVATMPTACYPRARPLHGQPVNLMHHEPGIFSSAWLPATGCGRRARTTARA